MSNCVGDSFKLKLQMTFRLAAPSSALFSIGNVCRSCVSYGPSFMFSKYTSARFLRIGTNTKAHTSQIIPGIAALPRSQLARVSSVTRSLHTSAVLRKISKSAVVSSKTGSDPFDLSELQAGIQKAIEKLKNELSKLRSGGRFNPELLENLAVSLDKKSKHTTRLKELAQVVPRGGRTVVIYVGEKDHVKPITSTILNSALNLTPQPDPQEPLQLNISIPPPTKESRLAALDTAQKTGKVAQTMVRDARGVQQKKFKAMFVARTVRPDDRLKAEKDMEKVVEKGQKEVEDIVKGAKKALESS
ncbi:MAG: hypothetical protein M1812_003123 [Candelaria pacifica]|nr:MAG: hypothetical protein M1812_003123 [Candelaria pacifica]